jgi:hypothetical protein
MAQITTILSARRSYEFRTDDLRLSLLSSRPVLEHIRQTFNFEVAMASPPGNAPGASPSNVPPGLVFAYGITPFPIGDAVAVRYILVEPRRITIDVVGPSSVLDPTFERLRELVSDLRTHEGFPALGEPSAISDASEIRVTLPFPAEALLPSPVRDAISKALLGSDPGQLALAPAISVRVVPIDEEYGSPSTFVRQTHLELRAGTMPDDRAYFSAAPLDTDSHLELLSELESVMSQQWQPEQEKGGLEIRDTREMVEHDHTARKGQRRRPRRTG